ncbi:ras GEF [Rickenella mellea]|uniref:Ras GEF n=1 Tax=Rickenella mellea TaxID=50990 RepID=A0A4Y7QGV9_9AGAM|nr:ras GEF [Rickenella mellea]
MDFGSSRSSVSPPQSKRRSRMSINGFLAPSVFRNGITPGSTSPPASSQAFPLLQPPVPSSSQGYVQTTIHRSPDGGRSPPPRKLRKTRSIPDMYGGIAEATVGRPPPIIAGRVHSHSVTGADMPHWPRQQPASPEETSRSRGDMFSEVMGWNESSASSHRTRSTSVSVSSPLEEEGPEVPPDGTPIPSKEFIEHPFGRGVSFDSPHRNSAVFLPLVIREMQSFESGLTARAESYLQPLTDKDKPSASSSSASSIIARPMSPDPNAKPPKSGPSFETAQHSRYATSVFDVIQTYRGLPMLDTLSADSREPTIKMSLSALDGAAPRDDPRFVIWGELDVAATDDASLLESHTDFSSQSGVSRRKSGKGNRSAPQPLPELRLSSADGSRRIMMAATIERWIAQLTSQFDYDELLIFFLTYRTYIDAVDLCHLLICRFHWALEEPTSAHEVMVRQVVRVRTFVAIRYWLLTFFRVDFIPNRELCLLFANWLNTLRRDPILTKYPDALNIVRKLKKIVKDCRAAHTYRKSTSRLPAKKTKQITSIDRILGDLSNSTNFAASLRKVTEAEEEEESDVDLDFNPEESVSFPDQLVGIQGFASFANQLGPDNVSGGDVDGHKASLGAASSISPGRPLPSASHIMMQQPLHMTILQHAKAAPPGENRPLVQTPATLPVHHSALSRAVVNTIGRLGRWKRVLSSRSPTTPLAPCADVSAIDLELNAEGDLLTVRGGVEQYLKMIEPTPSDDGHGLATLSEQPDDASLLASPQPSIISMLPAGNSTTDIPEDVPSTVVVPPEDHVEPLSPANVEGVSPEVPVPRQSVEVQSLLSSEGSHNKDLPAPPVKTVGSWHPEIVSIDDLDLSDMSGDDEPHPPQPPGLRRQPRRLPLRRDFEFVRRSADSVSSMGIISRPSIAMSERADSMNSSSSSNNGPPQLSQWQMNALVDELSDDEDGPGDAEAALRRLEGQINHQAQQAKEAKVDGWVRTMQQRLAQGDFRDDRPRNFSDDEDEDDNSDEDYGTGVRLRDLGDDADAPSLSPTQEVVVTDDSADEPNTPSVSGDVSPDMPLTPTPEQTSRSVNDGSSGPTSPASTGMDTKLKVREFVPSDILQNRMSSQPTVPSVPPRIGRNIQTASFVQHSTPNIAATHHSFILNHRSEVLAQHFAVIDREIFLGIRFEELVSEDWHTPSEELNVLDWGQFLKDRRHKIDSRGEGRTSALAASRARFNLLANFTLSEIVMSQPNERVRVVNKFIRVAWKAYLQNNFATLVALIAGLNSDWVKKAMRRLWSRVGIWETRVFEDLKAFTTTDDNFRYIRQAVTAITDAKPLTSAQDDSNASTGPTDNLSSTSRSRSYPDGKPHAPVACVPFLGVYLSQLHAFSKMPDLIDASAPTESVVIDGPTGNFEAPAHPEVFSTLQPLPSSMQLEPLINVQKQRLIAGVIKALVAGQHLANKVEVNIDKKLLHRCLRLRALDSGQLQRASSQHSDY